MYSYDESTHTFWELSLIRRVVFHFIPAKLRYLRRRTIISERFPSDEIVKSMFRRKSLKLTEPTISYKGEYLGNVSTNVAKGEKCAEKPLALLWSNYNKSGGQQTLPMLITIDNSGLKVVTQTQGLTHYWCHRVSHFSVSKSNPRIFVWIYRHVAKKLKVELRCHAVLMKNEKKARSLVENLTDKMAVSLQEYKREKAQKQRRRLLDAKAADYISKYAGGTLGRTKHLSPSKNYKPPTEYSLNSPNLQAISEDCEETESPDEDSDIETTKYSTIGRYTMRNKFRKNYPLRNGFPPSPDPSVTMTQPDDDDDEEYNDISGFATLPRNHRKSTSFPKSPSLDEDAFLFTPPSDTVNESQLAQIPDINQDIPTPATMPDLIISSLLYRGIPDGEHQDPGIPIEERMPFSSAINKYAIPKLSSPEKGNVITDNILSDDEDNEMGSLQPDRVIDGGEASSPELAIKFSSNTSDLTSAKLPTTNDFNESLQSIEELYSRKLNLMTDNVCSHHCSDFDTDFSDVEIVQIVTRL